MEKEFMKVREELHKVYTQYKEENKHGVERVIGFQDCFIELLKIMNKFLEEGNE